MEPNHEFLRTSLIVGRQVLAAGSGERSGRCLRANTLGANSSHKIEAPQLLNSSVLRANGQRARDQTLPGQNVRSVSHQYQFLVTVDKEISLQAARLEKAADYRPHLRDSIEKAELRTRRRNDSGLLVSN